MVCWCWPGGGAGFAMNEEGVPLEALFIMDGNNGEFAYWSTPVLESQLEWLEPLDKYDLVVE